MKLVFPPISDVKSFVSFFVEEMSKTNLFQGRDGKPMVFYRGTQSKDNLFTNLGLLSFTTDPNVAKIYSSRLKSQGFDFSAEFVDGSTVGTYHLKMTNPMKVDEVNGTILNFIEKYLGGLKTIGEENTLKLLSYLANRESGKAKGPRFQYNFSYDAEKCIDRDVFMGVEIGPSLKSLHSTVKRHYADGSLVDVRDALDAVTIDYFVLIDAPVFKSLAKAAGYDGIIHADAFDAGPMVSQKLLGKKVGDNHLTYRPFDKSQVVQIKTRSMAPKNKNTPADLRESTASQKSLYDHGLFESLGSQELNDIDVESIETGVAVKGYLYHGSKSDDIEELDPYAPSYEGSLGWGLYLAEKMEAQNYGKYVYRVPVELKKPFRIEHRPIEADPRGNSIETMIDNELLALLKEKGQSFKDWYEKWAGFNAEYNHPFGSDVNDVIEEDGTLPEAFLKWMKEEDRALAVEIAKQLVKIDEWYSEAFKNAMAEAQKKKDPELYKKLTEELRNKRKAKLDAINSQKLEDLWDEWPANNVPVIASSILVGESVAPFWFVLGDEIFGCFDAGDMESISPSVQEAGYDSMVVEGLRAFSSFLGHEVVLFRSAVPDQVNGKPIQQVE